MPFCFLFFRFRKTENPYSRTNMACFSENGSCFQIKKPRGRPGMTALSLRPSDNEKNGSPIFFALGKRKIRIPGKNCFKNLSMRSFSLSERSFLDPEIGIFPVLCRIKLRKALCAKASAKRGSNRRYKRFFLKCRWFIPRDFSARGRPGEFFRCRSFQKRKKRCFLLLTKKKQHDELCCLVFARCCASTHRFRMYDFFLSNQ